MKEYGTLFAVDPSLTASGWALFSMRDQRPLAVGVLSPPPPPMPLSQRLQILQHEVQEIIDHFDLGDGDVLVCEGPAPLVLNPNSALKVERVRGIFETLARQRRMSVPGRINPRTVQSELMGMRGKQLSRDIVKQWARDTAGKMFGRQLHAVERFGFSSKGNGLPQDVIDALLIGALAVSKIKLSIHSNVEIERAFDTAGAGRRRAGRGRSSGWSEQELKRHLQVGNQGPRNRK